MTSRNYLYDMIQKEKLLGDCNTTRYNDRNIFNTYVVDIHTASLIMSLLNNIRED